MITMPYTEIVAKIMSDAGLSEEEIHKKVKQKLDVLSGLISKEGAAHIIANELGVKLVQEGPVAIKNLHAGMKNAEITGKVTRKYELREFSSGDRKGKVASLVLADDSGFVRLVLWNDQADAFAKIVEGDVIQVQNALVKENMGRKELHLNTASKMLVNPKGVSVDVKQDSAVRKKISELVAGDDNVEIFGTIVQVFDMRFFEVCPKCGKRLSRQEENTCDAHGTVTPDHSYVLNLFVDDGSGNSRIVLWKTQVQRLLKKTDDEIKAFNGKQAEFEAVKSGLLGNFIKFVGRVNKNEGYDSLEFVPRLVFPDPDPKEELALVKKEPKVEEKKVERNSPKESDLIDAVSEDDFLDVEEEDFEE